MCERFGLTEAKPVHTPMDSTVVFKKAIDMSELHPDNELYRSISGSLIYAAQLCRPDILYAVCRLSQHPNEPTMTHMTEAKRSLVYLYTHQHRGITYGKKIHDIIGHNIIYCYADADFASDLDSRKSTTGWVFMYNGGAITVAGGLASSL